MALSRTHSDCGTAFESGPLQECYFDSILHAREGMRVMRLDVATKTARPFGRTWLLLSTPDSGYLSVLIEPRKCTNIPRPQCILAAALFMGSLLSSSVQSRPALALTRSPSIRSDYAVFRIREDVWSLFRSIVVGEKLRQWGHNQWAHKGQAWDLECMQSEYEQQHQAEQLRNKVMIQLDKTEPLVQRFIEFSLQQIAGDVTESGELEILMASNVLRTTIRVFMYVEHRGGIFLIAEYGKQYKSEHPINILYRGDSPFYSDSDLDSASASASASASTRQNKND